MSDLVKVSLDLSGVVAQALYFSTTIPERIRPTTIVNSNTRFYDSLPGLLNDSNKVRVSATIASDEDQSNFFSTTITERIRPSVIALDNLQEYSVYNTETTSEFIEEKAAVSDGVSSNDCWGYTSPTGKKYALIGRADRLSIYEITNNTFVSKGFVPHISSSWSDIKVYEDHCYCVNESGGGLQIISLVDIDETDYSPIVTTTTTPWETCHNLYVDEINGILYALGTNSSGTVVPRKHKRREIIKKNKDTNNNIQYHDEDEEGPGSGTTHTYTLKPITSLSNTTNASASNPVPLPRDTSAGEVMTYYHDLMTYTYTPEEHGVLDTKTIAYCSGQGQWVGVNGGFDIIDVTDPNNWNKVVNTVTDYQTEGAGDRYMHQMWTSSDGRYIFANDEGQTTHSIIVHDMNPIIEKWKSGATVNLLDTPELKYFSDPSNPGTMRGFWGDGSPTINHNLYVHWIPQLQCDVIFNSCYETGTRLCKVIRDDVSNTIAIEQIGVFDSYNGGNPLDPDFNGHWSNYYWNDGEGLWIANDINNGSYLLKTNWETKVTTLPFTKYNDIPYREIDGINLHLDAYIPDGGQTHTAIIYIHGGAFVSGSEDDQSGVNFATNMVGKGYAVFSIEYRFTTLWSLLSDSLFQDAINDAVTDAFAAMTFIKNPPTDSLQNFGISTFNIHEKIFVAGYSAGAITALNMGIDTDESRTTLQADIAGVISIAGSLYLRVDEIVTNSNPNPPPIMLWHGKEDWIVYFSYATAIEDKCGQNPNQELTFYRFPAPMGHFDIHNAITPNGGTIFTQSELFVKNNYYNSLEFMPLIFTNYNYNASNLGTELGKRWFISDLTNTDTGSIGTFGDPLFDTSLIDENVTYSGILEIDTNANPDPSNIVSNRVFAPVEVIFVNGNITISWQELTRIINNIYITPKSYTLIMNDSYGDGWNGAYFNIYNNNTSDPSIESFTIDNGDTGTEKFVLEDGVYNIICGGGTFDSEITWTLIHDITGHELIGNGDYNNNVTFPSDFVAP